MPHEHSLAMLVAGFDGLPTDPPINSTGTPPEMAALSPLAPKAMLDGIAWQRPLLLVPAFLPPINLPAIER